MSFRTVALVVTGAVVGAIAAAVVCQNVNFRTFTMKCRPSALVVVICGRFADVLGPGLCPNIVQLCSNSSGIGSAW